MDLALALAVTLPEQERIDQQAADWKAEDCMEKRLEGPGDEPGFV